MVGKLYRFTLFRFTHVGSLREDHAESVREEIIVIVIEIQTFRACKKYQHTNLDLSSSMTEQN